MARPLRIEFPGALYHITSRGNEKRDIFLDSRDREASLELLSYNKPGRGWIIYLAPLISYASGGQGVLFEKTTPLDPPQKLFIKKAS